MSEELRVVFLADDSTAYVECPVCFVDARERGYCWFCECVEWDRAINWDWDTNVRENVENVGGGEETGAAVEHLTVTRPEWLDPKTGQPYAGALIPDEDVVYLDPDVGGLTFKRPAGRPARPQGFMDLLGCCADEPGDPMEGCGQATRAAELEAEVVELRAKLAEAEATIEQLRSPHPRVAFEWHPCPICGHDTKHTHAQPSQLLASPARCAVCGVAHEVTR